MPQSPGAQGSTGGNRCADMQLPGRTEESALRDSKKIPSRGEKKQSRRRQSSGARWEEKRIVSGVEADEKEHGLSSIPGGKDRKEV